VGHDEIDLLVRFGELLAAVEVKTRVGSDPADELTPEKSARVRRAGSRLRPRPRRYDLISVCAGPDGITLRWLPGAG
jgi:Holliday junction resolvase-like predicted endonuclease